MSGRAAPQPPHWWFDGSPPPLHARLLSAVYGAAISARRLAYRRGWRAARHPGVPVVIVGNLTAGGSGKTPLAIELVERLQRAGWTPGVATRGYGRKDAGKARWVAAGDDPALSGDEPLLIATRTRARVRVDRDRLAAARALAEAGCDIVVCDDGLQHYALARDIEIEVQDARRGYGNGRLLPAGPLREPLERAADCSLRVLNLGVSAPGSPPAQQATGEWPMHLVPGDARPLAGGRKQPLSAFVGQRVHAVAGIGDPERFFGMLRGMGIAVVPHAFPDHHAYGLHDFAFGSALPILMTEKDAVKCHGLGLQHAFVVPVDAQLPEPFWRVLLDRLPRR